MKLLAPRKFQEKIGISFALLIALVAINTVVAALASYFIAAKTDRQQEIQEIIRDVERTRLAVTDFTHSLDRKLAEKVFNQIALTRHQIKGVAARYENKKLSTLLSQLDDFKARFQKYMVEIDQMKALESHAIILGHGVLDQLNAARKDGNAFYDLEAFDAIVSRVLNIIWQVQELQSRTRRPSVEQMNKVKAELEDLRGLARKGNGTYTQRLLFRIVRDVDDYVASYEGHLRYRDINADTERALFQISAQIHADCDQISSGMEAGIRRQVTSATAVAILLFLTTLIAAPVLARYLTSQILKPIHKLVSITKQVAAGYLDVHAPVEVDDAIGKLSRHFNNMTESMKGSREQLLEKQRALEEARDELEQRVELRTRELATTNSSLQAEIVARKQSEAEIRSSEEKFRAMFELSPLGMARNSLDGFFIEANHAFQDMLGYSMEALRQRRLPDLYAEDPEISWNDLVAAFRDYGSYSLREVYMRPQDGRVLVMRLNGVLITDGDGRESLWSVCEDITEQKKSEEVIWNQANFDPLTGLPNRRMFLNSLDHEIKSSSRQSQLLALMFLDLDKFKEVNDTLGHDKGDILLIEAARRISNCVRETDMVARLGGDEFTVILPNLDSTGNVERVARKIIEVLSQSFDLAGDEVLIGASVGIALYPCDAGSSEELMNYADQAMYQAKAGGRNRFCYFTQTLQEFSQKRSLLIKDMRIALSDGQFELYYQPIIELAGGGIHKAETLIRWRHPTLGLVSPAEFIPLAEETRMIAEIGDWVFREVAKQAKHLRANHDPRFQISINKSPVQFRTDQIYVQDWLAFIGSLDLSNQAIVIEITEDLLQDATEQVTNRLREYRNAGLQLSLDNFGAGYSSLAYLNRFDIDYLKIAQTFIRNMETDSNEIALCEAIILMAHRLGLKVIAEGVETSSQHDVLVAAGCDYVQGFLYSRPLPLAKLEDLLSSHPLNSLAEKKLEYSV
jgi:diguanylate cyclase (GGDEF)-like protein/PAS domain S-box-containing protein